MRYLESLENAWRWTEWIKRCKCIKHFLTTCVTPFLCPTSSQIWLWSLASQILRHGCWPHYEQTSSQIGKRCKKQRSWKTWAAQKRLFKVRKLCDLRLERWTNSNFFDVMSWPPIVIMEAPAMSARGKLQPINAESTCEPLFRIVPLDVHITSNFLTNKEHIHQWRIQWCHNFTWCSRLNEKILNSGSQISYKQVIYTLRWVQRSTEPRKENGKPDATIPLSHSLKTLPCSPRPYMWLASAYSA